MSDQEPTPQQPSTAGHWAKRIGVVIAAHLLPIVVAAGIFYTYTERTMPPLTGDEPCYLLQSKSLIDDHDLNLADDVTRTDGVVRYSSLLLNSPTQCAVDYRSNGEYRSWFNPGLPLLMLPILAVTFELVHIRYAMAMFSALFAWQLLCLLRDIGGKRAVAPWFAWAGTVFFLPVMGFAGSVYPELPAAFAITVAARCLLRARKSTRLAWLGVVLMAATPWLHFRFGFIAAVMTACIAMTAVWRTDLPTRGRRILNAAVRSLPFFVPMVVSVGILLGLFWHLYGSPSPSAAYDGNGAELTGLTGMSIYRTGVGSFLGLTQGLFVVAPLMILAVAALPLIVRRFGWTGAVLIAAAVAQVFLINPMGFFGYTLAGRFVVVLLPLFAVALVLAFQARRVAASVMGAGLALIGLVPLVQSYDRFGEYLDLSRPQSPWQRDTAAVWPTMTYALGTSYELNAAEVGPRLGTVTGPAASKMITATPADGAGVIVTTTPSRLRPGTWSGDVQAVLADNATVTIRVTDTATGLELSRQSFTESNAIEGDRPSLAFNFATETVGPIAYEISTDGRGTVEIGNVYGEALSNTYPADQPLIDDMPIATLWGAALLVLALYISDKRPARHFKRRERDEVPLPQQIVDLSSEAATPARPILHRKPS